MGHKTTVVYDAEGNVVGSTRTTTQPGCNSGCGWLVTVIAALFVVAAPAEYFPLPLAVLAYLVEGALVIACVAAAVQRARANRAHNA